ncbi:MAG: C1 family peptidase, partial [Gemmataceae bacterium]|nr:C1 family peptidase [Gemmataceae bacterium]
LLEHLEVSKQDLDGFLKDAHKAVPPSVAAEAATPDPYDYGLGAMRPNEAVTAEAAALAPPPEMMFAAVALPTAVNLIARMPPIRNQAGRGTCVAFTLTAIHDYATRLAGGQANNFSEQHLYYETKLIDGAPNGCGTWQAKAALALANRGQCLEPVWPYNPNPPCNNHGPLPAGARPNGLIYRFRVTGLVDATARNVAWIKSMLADRKPVGISIPVYNSWYSSSQTTKTGAITMRLGTEPNVGGHAVCLVGYQDSASAPGGGYFIVRNSWSTNWGYQCPYGPGYGTIPYQYITNDNWEAFGPVSVAAEQPDDDQQPDDHLDVKPARGGRTITIRVKGNVNLIIE